MAGDTHVDIKSGPAMISVPAPEPPTASQESFRAEAQTQQGHTAVGQRRVNLIWEVTQSLIAIAVVFANLAVSVHVGWSNEKSAVPEVLSNSLFLVIGFYFSRTNHTAIGGVGRKPDPPYEGR